MFQLLGHEELDPAASVGGQDLGKGFIRLPALVVWTWARISVVLQPLEHEEHDSAANAGGTLLDKKSCRVLFAGIRRARSSCLRWRSGLGQRFLTCSSCWNTRSSIQLPMLVVRILAVMPVVIQLLEHEELGPAASACGQDWGKDFCKCSSCWNTKGSIQLPILEVRIRAGICAMLQSLAHEETDSAATAGGIFWI